MVKSILWSAVLNSYRCILEFVFRRAEVGLTYVCFRCMPVCMKRTTLILEEATLDAVRDLARREKRDMSDIVNEALRDGLRLRRRKSTPAPELPSYRMGRAGTNLADRDALEALMEGE